MKIRKKRRESAVFSCAAGESVLKCRYALKKITEMIRLKRLLSIALALACALLSGGCAKKQGGAEVTVFAAASLTETLTEIAERYQTVAPEVTLRFNFDSSGTLKTQIEEGADCDLFLSAAPKQMNELISGGLIAEETRVDLLENEVALVVPEGNPKGLWTYYGLAEALRSGDVLLAMGNADVPVGQYTRKIFDYYGLDENKLAARGVLTYGSNVKEVTTQVAEAAVDCGIIYRTDAYSANLTVVDTAEADMCGRVVYPAAVLQNAAHASKAAAFLAYLQGPEATAIFETVGFTSLAK